MAVSGVHFFNHASSLLEREGATEIELRNAVSLAYYSVFHMASELADLLRDIPLSSISGSTHQKLSNFFLNRDGIQKKIHLSKEDVQLMRLTGGKLLRLHSHRVVADYRLKALFELATAQEVLKTSQKVLEDLNCLTEKLLR